jgi:hypothetical protein
MEIAASAIAVIGLDLVQIRRHSLKADAPTNSIRAKSTTALVALEASILYRPSMDRWSPRWARSLTHDEARQVESPMGPEEPDPRRREESSAPLRRRRDGTPWRPRQ